MAVSRALIWYMNLRNRQVGIVLRAFFRPTRPLDHGFGMRRVGSGFNFLFGSKGSG